MVPPKSAHRLPASLAALLLLTVAASGAPAARLPAGLSRGYLAGEASPMVFLILHKRMTVAYDERGGSLFLAWDGPLAAASARAAGPSPAPAPAPASRSGIAPALYEPSGPVYHRRIAPSPWSVRGPEGNIPVTVTFKGAAALGELAALDWTLRLPDGRAIAVREVPMFDDHYGDKGLFRNFTVTGIPPGLAVRLDLAGRGLEETWGGGGNGGLAEEGGRWHLVQKSDGDTPLKVTWSAPPAAGLPAWRAGPE